MKYLSKVSLITIALLSTSANAWFWDKTEDPKAEVKEVSAGGELAALKAKIAELEAEKARSNLYTEVAKDNEHLKSLIGKLSKDQQFATFSKVFNKNITNRQQLYQLDEDNLKLASAAGNSSKVRRKIEEAFRLKSKSVLAINAKIVIDLNHIDVSRVKDMSGMFYRQPFNFNISQWDVSKVTSMLFMFKNSQFNGDISQWDVSNVTNMEGVFQYSKFNGDISKWDVSNVTDMSDMFYRSHFIGDISDWDVSDIDRSNIEGNIQARINANFVYLVRDEIKRLGNNANLNHLDVSKVTNMYDLFRDSQFNGDISEWDVSKVMSMESMFRGSQFNGDISKWDVSNVTNMQEMFFISKFNGDISKWTVKPEGYIAKAKPIAKTIPKAKAKPIAKTIPKAKAKPIAKTNKKPMPASYVKPQGKLIPVSSLKTQGKLIYIPKCMKCHLKNGTGMPPIFPALKGSKVANGADHLNIDIVLNGKGGMPNHKKMSDLELASVITYIRSSFGNKGNPVFPYMIKSRRK